MTRHVYHCPIRWSDMDVYQHVNNAVFLTYLEEARSDMLGVHAARAGVDTFAAGCVSAKHGIEYKTPLEWRETAVDVEVWVTDLRAASFNLAYEVKDEGTLYAKAASTMVPYDLKSRLPRRLTDSERAYLTRFLAQRPA
ncbi:thioesterase family protein [Streptomyces sp. NPDC049597]|uniref:acyl-CoA thioesterase n=1 Tax=Streptomyces sp. NPDC049597 TaxID=3155276 RepID=UPI0034171677